MEPLVLIKNRLRAAGSWQELMEDMSDVEIKAMRDMPMLLAEIQRLYDDL
ncbi:MAG: hypothetical protein VKK63_11880 [Synechococcus sp.]|nr:hypothetical protein [Synechococcus sp.]